MNFDFNIADFFKLPTKIMASLAFASGMVLFLPESIISNLFMIEFRNNYGFILGLIFIVSFTILLVTLFISIYTYFHHKYLMKKFKATAHERLHKLTDYQKAIIYELYGEDNHTCELPLNDGAVHYLEHNIMIGKATTQYEVEDLNNPYFPYMLQPWVIEELLNSHELCTDFQSNFKRMEAKYKGKYE
ncbi:MAG: superinfection exclusion B family protein [Erysipelotrichaceae bacterium]